MATILDTIAAYARERVATDKREASLNTLKAMCRERGRAGGSPFEAALRRDGLGFICEVKRASPSKGLIAPDFPYVEIARDYEKAGAECISCLTEPKWFLGSDRIFTDIRAAVSIPMLRKDFVVDEYQLYQARLMGADCILLICAILDGETIAQYLDICGELGLSALVEAHDEAEIASAIAAGAQMIGVNNRNLKDFSVDTENSRRLRELVPRSALFVSESGVRTAEDIRRLRAAGVDAVLVGETLMRSADKTAKLAELRGEV